METDDDGQTFEALYRGLHPLVVRTVYLVVFDAGVAQEITNEAFLRLWQHRRKLGEQVNGRAWVMRVAFNLAIDHRRSLLARLRHREPAAVDRDPGSLAITRLEIEQMRSALLGLRPRDRAILGLRYDQGLSFPEIAQVLGRPEATARTWAHRALERLRRRFTRLDGAPSTLHEEPS